MKFVKMQGCGNDYIYLHETAGLPKDKSALVKKMCDRHFGIGADGVIFIHIGDGVTADFEMEIYNADGSYAEMCGNGILCVGRYVYEQGLTDKREMNIASGSVVRRVWLYPDSNSTVRVNMGKPELACERIPVLFSKKRMLCEPVRIGEKEYNMTCVNMGNPHAVILTDREKILHARVEGEPLITKRQLLEYLPYQLSEEGAAIERAAMFPERTNVEFVCPIDQHNIIMRVWERGSGETCACGTGSCAAVMACIINGLTKNTVTVTLLGGTLYVEWDADSEEIYLTGPADTVYAGEAQLSHFL
ncbi:MAG: diaminopimelate epimerase [Lachnospiraceae bacterium]|nr:diaminopimelate epimerase [Lachnospiraceae bacterium]